MPGQLGPLLSAVQHALAQAGVRHRTVNGQWRIEFTEEALLWWLSEQHKRIRAEVEQAVTSEADGDGQSPYSEQEAAYARSVLRTLLVEARNTGAQDVGVSELLRHMSRTGVERSRTWVFQQLSRFQEQGLVRHDRSQKRWLLLEGLDFEEGHDTATT